MLFSRIHEHCRKVLSPFLMLQTEPSSIYPPCGFHQLLFYLLSPAECRSIFIFPTLIILHRSSLWPCWFLELHHFWLLMWSIPYRPKTSLETPSVLSCCCVFVISLILICSVSVLTLPLWVMNYTHLFWPNYQLQILKLKSRLLLLWGFFVL